MNLDDFTEAIEVRPSFKHQPKVPGRFELKAPPEDIQVILLQVDGKKVPSALGVMLELCKLLNSSLPSGPYSRIELTYMFIASIEVEQILHIQLYNYMELVDFIDLIEMFDTIFSKARNFSVYLELIK